jgi:uncharacterized protein (DUF952 family)
MSLSASTSPPIQHLIYKITPAALWHEAERLGVFNGSSVDLRDGFIHFSTATQLADTAKKYFAGQNDLLLITVEASRVSLTWEPSRDGQLFPHLYGTLPLNAVISVDVFDAPLETS